MSKRLSLKRNSALVGGMSMDGNSVDVVELDNSPSADIDASQSSLKKTKADENGAKVISKSTLSSKSASNVKLASKSSTITRVIKSSSSSSSALKASKEVEKDANKVSITLSSSGSDSNNTSTEETTIANTSTDDATAPSTSIDPTDTNDTPSSITTSPSRKSGTWRVPQGAKGTNSKYNTLPLPPKARFPISAAAATGSAPSGPTSSGPSSNPSQPKPTSTAPTASLQKSASSTASLGKTSAPSIAFKPSSKPSAKPSSSKPPAGRPLTTLQLQEQTRKLLLQVQQQKELLEQQQQQIETSQLTQNQLQQKIQLQELEQQLLQQEQQEKQQQLEHHVLTQQQLQQRLQMQQMDQLRQQQILQQMQFQFNQPQFSPAAKLFISQNVFQSTHTERKSNPASTDFLHTGTYTADFLHTPTQAIAAFNEWKESQWLVPPAFASQLDPLMLVPLHLPFFSFSLITHSVHRGRIGYFKKPVEAEVSASEFSAITYEFAPERAESSTHTQLHPDVLVYAPSFDLVTTPDYELMQEIWYWKLNDLKQQTAISKRHSLPVVTKANNVTPIDVKMPQPISVQEAWTYAHQKLLRNERYCAAQMLKRELNCDIVQEIRTDTTFSHVAVKLVYLPVYVWIHNYQGNTYHTVMNAQNGLVHGRRPYALKSSLDSCFQLLAGGEKMLSKNDVVQGVISGAELARRDNYSVHTSPYRVDLPYIVFPPSDQFLVVVATGWIRVQNTSTTETVELIAQKRTSSHIGRSLILLPGDEKVVAYRGAWCFCVATGDPQSVLIAYVCTHSGADKDDLMGMV